VAETPATADCTKEVVAIWELLVPPAGAGAVGVPVKAGLFIFAFKLLAAVTKAVLAIKVVLLPAG
jgi:hypothetical protein